MVAILNLRVEQVVHDVSTALTCQEAAMCNKVIFNKQILEWAMVDPRWQLARYAA